ncbi:hypothetical protein [Klebsiella quasipneumoniae]|uniref:hypothetical protein n=1 Tax=Klebsiella quasipneumoniae TaxID=1463165 RepID=UPI003F1A1ADB
MSYGWLFENPDDDISGGNHINLEHLPPELKHVVLQIVQNQINRDTAGKTGRINQATREFDITAAELSAYLLNQAMPDGLPVAIMVETDGELHFGHWISKKQCNCMIFNSKTH